MKALSNITVNAPVACPRQAMQLYWMALMHEGRKSAHMIVSMREELCLNYEPFGWYMGKSGNSLLGLLFN